MAVKFAKAFGAHVVLFTTSPDKIEDAKRLGAAEIVISKNKDEMKAHAKSFDFILDCVSAPHDINAYLNMLKREGTLALLGVPDTPPMLQFQHLIYSRRKIGGSLIGGIAETQEMLDVCAEHDIVPAIERISIKHDRK